MSIQTLKRDYRESLSEGVELLVCPACSVPLTPQSMTCPECGSSGREHGRIVSFRPPAEDPDGTGPESGPLEELALLTEQHEMRAATAGWFDGRNDERRVRSELFNASRDAWRMLVGDRISGRCLDVPAGFGRRSMLLAELADTFYAVDPALSKLRVAAARDDFDSGDDVVPVHTDVDELPFADGAFDTVVADATGQAGVRRYLSTLAPYLSEGGTLVATVDGWPRRTGLSRLLGLDDRSSAPAFGGLRPTTPDGFRSLGEQFGFDRTTTYALFPTASQPLYAFEVDDEAAVDAMAEFVFGERGSLGSLGKPLVSAADRCGLLQRSFPSYLVVYESDEAEQCAQPAGRAEAGDRSRSNSTGGERSPSPEFSRPMLIAGRSRSVVLELGDDGPTAVWKIPNRRTHEALSRRENSVLEVLRSRDEPIAETLPSGVEVDSAFGTCRREEPVDGRSLGRDSVADPDSFERVLRIGFEWLAEFQRRFGGDRIVRSPEQVREDLRLLPAGLEPPAIDGPVETFSTPVHGDFLAQNIYVEDDRIASVIDWEYGALEASPIVDAGLLLLDAAARSADGFHEGVRRVLDAETEHAARANDCVEWYCDAVGIPPRTFGIYLPSVYLHRLRLDWRCDATSTYSGRMDDRARAAEFLYGRQDSPLFD